MPQCYLGKRIKQIYLNGDIKRAYIGSQLFFSRSQKVTYYVDTNKTYEDEIDYGESCFASASENFKPNKFTPQKEGCTFLGWVENINDVPDADNYTDVENVKKNYVLQEKIMGAEPISLYAVFTKPVTATFKRYYSTQATTQIKKPLYYNNDTVSAPSFIVPATVAEGAGTNYNGWTWRGWSVKDNTVADANVNFANGSSIGKLYNDAIYYGLYKQDIIQTFKHNGTSTVPLTRYYNAYGNTLNPKLTKFPEAGQYSGWTFRGWSAANVTAGNASVYNLPTGGLEVKGDNTFYGLYSTSIQIIYAGNGNTGGSTSASSKQTRYWSASGQYVNPKFTISSCGFTKYAHSFSKWGTTTTGGTTYTAGQTNVEIASNITLYALWTAVKTVIYNADFEPYGESERVDATTGRIEIGSFDVTNFKTIKFDIVVKKNHPTDGSKIELYIGNTRLGKKEIGYVGENGKWEGTIEADISGYSGSQKISIARSGHTNSTTMTGTITIMP